MDFEILTKQFNVNTVELQEQFKLLKSKNRGENDSAFPPSHIPDWINWFSKFQKSSTFENFRIILNKFTTMPITSCTSERSLAE